MDVTTFNKSPLSIALTWKKVVVNLGENDVFPILYSLCESLGRKLIFLFDFIH